MACECFARINKQLAERGATRLVNHMTFTEEKGDQPSRLDMLDRAQIAVELCADKKRGEKPLTLIATFCPFCGVRYEEALTS